MDQYVGSVGKKNGFHKLISYGNGQSLSSYEDDANDEISRGDYWLGENYGHPSITLAWLTFPAVENLAEAGQPLK